jgi:hypothetical protein
MEMVTGLIRQGSTEARRDVGRTSPRSHYNGTAMNVVASSGVMPHNMTWSNRAATAGPRGGHLSESWSTALLLNQLVRDGVFRA